MITPGIQIQLDVTRRPKTFTEFAKYLEDKYLYKPNTKALETEIDADIEYFVGFMVHNALINKSIAEDTRIFLKNIITIY